MEATVSRNSARLRHAPVHGDGSRRAGGIQDGVRRAGEGWSVWIGLLAEVLQVLARLEADRPSGRDLHFLARPRVAPDAALPRLHLEDTEPAQFDPLAALSEPADA